MASINDKLRKYKSLFSTTLSTGIGTGTSDTITPATVTGLPTDTAITLTIDRVDSAGTATPSKLERIKGIISGGNLIDYVRGVDGTTEQAHSAGAVVEMVWNAADWNDMADWGLVQHGQNGVHSSALVTSLKATASDVNTGTSDTTIVTPKAIADSKLADFIRGDGWISANETWTYASATTITVPSGAASKYAKGDKIKLTQSGTVKYFYIISVADTVLTITGGSDYTLVSATISANYYSHAGSPIGFPSYFSYTPVCSSSDGTAPTFSSRNGEFSINGSKCSYFFRLDNSSGGTGTGDYDTLVSIPVAPSISSTSTRGFAQIAVGGKTTNLGVWVLSTLSFRLSIFFSLQNSYFDDAIHWLQGFAEYMI